MSTSSVNQIIKDPIANRQSDKTLKPIANSLLVDQLLKDYSDLIQPTYKKWFAQRFYTVPAERVANLASEARADGKDPQKLFAFLIKRAYNSMV